MPATQEILFENINKKNAASDNISYTYFCYEGVLVVEKATLINYATGGMEIVEI